MSEGYFHRLHRETPTRFWINNPTEVETDLALAAGAVGCTTNPSYAARIIRLEPDRAVQAIREVLSESPYDGHAAVMAQQRIVKGVMDKFLGLYEAAPGRQGFVSIQGDPHADGDVNHIVDEALQFEKLSANFITKIPCTGAGLKALEQLIPRGMPLIATEVFAISQAMEVCELYQRVSQQWGVYPPFFVSHISGIFDEYLAKTAEREGVEISPQTLAQAGCMLAKKQYEMMQCRGYKVQLMGGGARGTRHFTEMVGGAVHVTINWNTAEEINRTAPAITSRIAACTPQSVSDELCDKFPDFRAAFQDDGLAIEEFSTFAPLQYFRNMFVKGWDVMLAEIRKQRPRVPAPRVMEA